MTSREATMAVLAYLAGVVLCVAACLVLFWRLDGLRWPPEDDDA